MSNRSFESNGLRWSTDQRSATPVDLRPPLPGTIVCCAAPAQDLFVNCSAHFISSAPFRHAPYRVPQAAPRAVTFPMANRRIARRRRCRRSALGPIRRRCRPRCARPSFPSRPRPLHSPCRSLTQLRLHSPPFRPLTLPPPARSVPRAPTSLSLRRTRRAHCFCLDRFHRC
jgi:hypothetical protein